ncbi:hypothetical protein Ddc_22401 [Ditylenchus destructor]|nr:hypothetical protein Ddc_22401 [Ditylenchus destructor]
MARSCFGLVRQSVRIEPAALDAEAVGAEDVRVQAVADDHRRGFVEGARLADCEIEEADIGLRMAAGLGGRDETDVVRQARALDAAMLDGLDAVGAAEALDLEEVLAHLTALELAPQVDVDILVVGEQGVGYRREPEFRKRAREGQTLGGAEVEQGVVEVE